MDIEQERQRVARAVLDALAITPRHAHITMGGMVFPVPDMVKFRLAGFTFPRAGLGNSRMVYRIIGDSYDPRLILKIGHVSANTLEVALTEKFPEDFAKIYGSIDCAIVCELAETVDFKADPRCNLPEVCQRLGRFRKRYKDVKTANVGFIGDRLVMLDGGKGEQ